MCQIKFSVFHQCLSVEYSNWPRLSFPVKPRLLVTQPNFFYCHGYLLSSLFQNRMSNSWLWAFHCWNFSPYLIPCCDLSVSAGQPPRVGKGWETEGMSRKFWTVRKHESFGVCHVHSQNIKGTVNGSSAQIAGGLVVDLATVYLLCGAAWLKRRWG